MPTDLLDSIAHLVGAAVNTDDRATKLMYLGEARCQAARAGQRLEELDRWLSAVERDTAGTGTQLAIPPAAR